MIGSIPGCSTGHEQIALRCCCTGIPLVALVELGRNVRRHRRNVVMPNITNASYPDLRLHGNPVC